MLIKLKLTIIESQPVVLLEDKEKQNGAVAVLFMLIVLVYFIDKNLK